MRNNVTDSAGERPRSLEADDVGVRGANGFSSSSASSIFEGPGVDSDGGVFKPCLLFRECMVSLRAKVEVATEEAGMDVLMPRTVEAEPLPLPLSITEIVSSRMRGGASRYSVNLGS